MHVYVHHVSTKCYHDYSILRLNCFFANISSTTWNPIFHFSVLLSSSVKSYYSWINMELMEIPVIRLQTFTKRYKSKWHEFLLNWYQPFKLYIFPTIIQRMERLPLSSPNRQVVKLKLLPIYNSVGIFNIIITADLFTPYSLYL